MNWNRGRTVARVCLIGVVAASLLAACGSTKKKSSANSATGASLGPIKIGAIIDQTGSLSSLGAPLQKAMEARVQDVNSSGGVDGRQIQLSIKNGASDAAAAVQGARELAQEGVSAIIGPTSTTTVQGVLPIVTAAKIPTITQQGGMLLPTSSYVFGQNINPKTVQHQYIQYLKDKAGSKIGVIYAANALGQSQIELVRPIFQELGVTLVSEQAVDPAGTDYTTQMAALKQAGAQGVLGLVSGAPAVVAAKAFKSLQLPGFLLVQNLSAQQVGLFGDAYNVAIVPQPPLSVFDQITPQDPQYKLVKEYGDWAAQHGTALDLFAADGYDAVNIIVDSIKKAKSSDPDAIYKLWTSPSGYTYAVQAGPLKWSASDHQEVGWNYVWTKLDPSGPSGPRLKLFQG